MLAYKAVGSQDSLQTSTPLLCSSQSMLPYLATKADQSTSQEVILPRRPDNGVPPPPPPSPVIKAPPVVHHHQVNPGSALYHHHHQQQQHHSWRLPGTDDDERTSSSNPLAMAVGRRENGSVSFRAPPPLSIVAGDYSPPYPAAPYATRLPFLAGAPAPPTSSSSSAPYFLPFPAPPPHLAWDTPGSHYLQIESYSAAILAASMGGHPPPRPAPLFPGAPPPPPFGMTFHPPPPPSAGCSALTPSPPAHSPMSVGGKEGSLKHRILVRPSSESGATAIHPKGLAESPSERSRPPSPIPPRPCPPHPPLLRHYPPHFRKGSLIQLADGGLKCVEDLCTEDFLSSAELSGDLQIDSSTVMRIDVRHADGTASLGFLVGDQRIQVTVEASLEHPFFVFGQGWSSCCPERTSQRYALQCQRLQVGDVCISLTHRRRRRNARTRPVPNNNNPVHVAPRPRKRRWSASDAVTSASTGLSPPVEQRSSSLADAHDGAT